MKDHSRLKKSREEGEKVTVHVYKRYTQIDTKNVCFGKKKKQTERYIEREDIKERIR